MRESAQGSFQEIGEGKERLYKTEEKY